MRRGHPVTTHGTDACDAQPVRHTFGMKEMCAFELLDRLVRFETRLADCTEIKRLVPFVLHRRNLPFRLVELVRLLTE